MKALDKIRTWGIAAAALGAVAAVSAASCSQTPQNAPIVTFEGANRAATVCLAVNGTEKVAQPVPQDNCALVPSGTNGAAEPNQLFAVVTQTTRGELAVVDLTAGYIVDEDHSTPGFNFIPVGQNPSDVVVPPDGAWTYVSSASHSKPAIYAIDNTRLLGDTLAVKTPPLQLTDLSACLLPAPPRALAIAPTQAPGTGAGDAGAGSFTYDIVALLDGEGSLPAQVVTVDPSALTGQPAGSLPPCHILSRQPLSTSLPPTFQPGPNWPDGVPYVDGGVDLTGQFPPIAPAPMCGTTIDLDGGVVPPVTPAPQNDAAVGDAGAEDAGAPDGAPTAVGAGAPDAAISQGAAPPDGGFPLPVSPPLQAGASSMVMRDDRPILYVADSRLPMIHVFDVKPGGQLSERVGEPLLATSLTTPKRAVQVGPIAFSPATRDYKRYLYAVDEPVGSIMVYDVTDPDDPGKSPRVPLQRPHSELNPFAPVDRITFSGQSVSAITFATHDWPVMSSSGAQATQLAYTGLLCNPNPAAHPDSTTFNDLGAYYRVDQASVVQPNGTAESFPTRLRGVFAFAGLSNGNVVAIDVDDWDAPCRRPDPMQDGDITGSLDVPQTQTTFLPDGGYDPYGVPVAYQGVPESPTLAESPAVTLESYFPVSVPNRIRSSALVRNDPSSGLHVPALASTPTLNDVNGAPVATSGQAGIANPLLLPTALQNGWRDPSTLLNPTEPNPAGRMYLPDAGTVPDPATSPAPGVRLSFDDPTAQIQQNWTVTYEGVLPSSSGIVATIAPQAPGDYSRVTMTTKGANFCGLGVEDWGIGQARAANALVELENLASQGKLPPVSSTEAQLATWTTDYVEITDDLLQPTDPYWTLPQACWDNAADGISSTSSPSTRYDYCQGKFGNPGSDPNLFLSRDFPILEAYPDHLVIGRWGYPSDQKFERTQSRTIDSGSANNAPFLKALQCCFHSSAAFEMRAGGEWVAVGQPSVGMLHHVVASQDPAQNQRCVLSCESRNVLLNARSFDIPWGQPSFDDAGIPLPGSCSPPAMPPQLDRNDPLAMRNPLFAYMTWQGCGVPMLSGDHTLTARDLTWRFTVNGGFSPLQINTAGATSGAASTQSMLFIGPLGQLGVVDGAQQGLVIIDLSSVSVVANYF